jgi:hypothetical protein
MNWRPVIPVLVVLSVDPRRAEASPAPYPVWRSRRFGDGHCHLIDEQAVLEQEECGVAEVHVNDVGCPPLGRAHVGKFGTVGVSVVRSMNTYCPFRGVGSGPPLPAAVIAVSGLGATLPPGFSFSIDGSARALDHDLERRASEADHVAFAPDLRSDVETHRAAPPPLRGDRPAGTQRPGTHRCDAHRRVAPFPPRFKRRRSCHGVVVGAINLHRGSSQPAGHAGRNRVGAGLTPAPPTPPGVRVRSGRFASRPGNGGKGR